VIRLTTRVALGQVSSMRTISRAGLSLVLATTLLGLGSGCAEQKGKKVDKKEDKKDDKKAPAKAPEAK
jgi:hypothetical protein